MNQDVQITLKQDNEFYELFDLPCAQGVHTLKSHDKRNFSD